MDFTQNFSSAKMHFIVDNKSVQDTCNQLLHHSLQQHISPNIDLHLQLYQTTRHYHTLLGFVAIWTNCIGKHLMASRLWNDQRMKLIFGAIMLPSRPDHTVLLYWNYSLFNQPRNALCTWFIHVLTSWWDQCVKTSVRHLLQRHKGLYKKKTRHPGTDAASQCALEVVWKRRQHNIYLSAPRLSSQKRSLGLIYIPGLFPV